jgi:ATP-dependent Lon protease
MPLNERPFNLFKGKNMIKSKEFQGLEDLASKVDSKTLPRFIPVLTVRDTVVFPFMAMPLAVGREKSLAAVAGALQSDKMIFVLTQKEASINDPAEGDIYSIGTVAKILKSVKISEKNIQILVQGLIRAKIVKIAHTSPFIMAEVEYLVEDYDPNDIEINALAMNLRKMAEKIIEVSPNIPQEVSYVLRSIEDPSSLSDLIVSHLRMPVEEKQKLLENIDIKIRLKQVLELVTKEVQVLELSNKIQSEVKDELDKNQREYYLREQLKAIRKELGEEEDKGEEQEKLAKAIKKAKMPEAVEKVAQKELKRLGKMSQASAEYTVSRTYIDWLIELPWSASSKDNLDLKIAEDVLERDHYGLDKVKKRILEYLAVRKLKNDMKGPILCLMGPPGVGKTSLGKSVASALGRKFVRISLGGVRDEAEIRGHRRTYIGALPGKIINGIKKAGTNNPIFMLDEIDKLGTDFRGDPSSALLEVLDPEQNDTFVDHYLDVPFDLSKVLFITTGNQLDTVPHALRDRMEVIEIAGYTEEEKLEIAKKYLIPEQLTEHGLKDGKVKFTDGALKFLINSYTKEAGVRNLKREIASILRGLAKDIASGKEINETVDEKVVTKILGQVRFFSDVAERTSVPGVSIGLAWTPFGGDILFVEAGMMKGKGKLTLTGHLGDVMKESAQAALSFVKSNANHFGIDEDIFMNKDLHIHVPAGALPKDGPSAGITIMIALTSLLTKRLVRSNVAMTGEITLRGAILPVGGIKEKVLAAKRAGVDTIILPEKNRKDLEDVPVEIKNTMTFHFISRMEDAVDFALEEKPMNTALTKDLDNENRPAA